jgi:hypothetical protein
MLFHGDEDRPVNDLDIWIDSEKGNAYRCFDALNAIIPNSLDFRPNSLAIKGRKINLRGSRYDVEIFTSMDGVEFDESFTRCEKYTHNGEPLYFVIVRDLLAIKREAYKSYRERMDKEGKDIAFLENLLRTSP